MGLAEVVVGLEAVVAELMAGMAGVSGHVCLMVGLAAVVARQMTMVAGPVARLMVGVTELACLMAGLATLVVELALAMAERMARVAAGLLVVAGPVAQGARAAGLVARLTAGVMGPRVLDRRRQEASGTKLQYLKAATKNRQ